METSKQFKELEAITNRDTTKVYNLKDPIYLTFGVGFILLSIMISGNISLMKSYCVSMYILIILLFVILE